MKKFFALLLTAAMLILPVCSVSAAETYPEDFSWMNDENKGKFYDVTADEWFADYAYEANDRGLILGVDPNPYVRLFMPDDCLTREQALAVLFRISGGSSIHLIGAKYETGMADVPAESWYAQCVAWGLKNGITKGVGGDYFGTGRAITREELAAMMLRCLEASKNELIDAEPAVDAFGDAADISEWARDAVEHLRAYGILTGDENGNVRPSDVITRAEAVAMLVRFDAALIPENNALLDLGDISLQDIGSLRLTVDVDGPDVITHSITDSEQIAALIGTLETATVTGSKRRAEYTGTAGSSIALLDKNGEKLWGYTFSDNCLMTASRIYYLDKAYFTEYTALLDDLVDEYYS